MEVTTLMRETENIVKKVKITDFKGKILNIQDSKKVRNKLNFDGDLLSIVNEIIAQNNPSYSLTMQLLPAKEIQALLQKEFKIFNFEVNEVEAETSKRIALYSAPYNYALKPENEEIKTFLEDLQNEEDILIEENSEIIKWSSKKVKFKIKEESRFYSKDKEYLVGNTVKAVKINIKGLNGEQIIKRPIFTIPGVNIDLQKSENLLRNLAIGGNIPSIGEYQSKDYSPDNLYKIMDLNYLVSICKVLEMCVEYIDEDPGFLYNKACSYYDELYTIEDMFKLLDIGFLVEHKQFMNKNTMRLICECAIAVTHMKDNEFLIKKYKQNLLSEYAKSFETKKNIPDKIKAAMKNNGFLESFSFIELDELIDIEKFYLIENEFLSMKEFSNLGDYLVSNSELRFKRLGQHKAAGLYYPEQKCICIDINNPQSFMHEVAHHIDYTKAQKELSNQTDFRMVSIMYKKALEETLKKEDNIRIANHFKRKRSYFYTPTEIFARCFEIYLVEIKNVKSSLLPNKSHFNLTNGYPELNELLLSRIRDYFENIFDIQYNLDTTKPRAEQILIEYALSNETQSKQDCSITSIIEEREITTILNDNSTNQEQMEIIDNIVEIHDNDFFFRIIEESINTIDVQDRPKVRRRRKRLNRSCIEEDYAVQLSLL